MQKLGLMTALIGISHSEIMNGIGVDIFSMEAVTNRNLIPLLDFMLKLPRIKLVNSEDT